MLDVGTGDGTYAIEAAARGATVTAIDAHDGMLAAATARAAQSGVSVAFERSRAEALPFGDGSFDLVIAVTVLCFANEAVPLVREMTRVLAPRGRLVLGELGRHSLWAAERRVRGWLGAAPWRRARFRTRRELFRIVERAGLRVVAERSAVFFPPSALAARMLVRADPLLSRMRAPGAAFLAIAAERST